MTDELAEIERELARIEAWQEQRRGFLYGKDIDILIGICRQLRDALVAERAARKQERWIPVGERLPKMNELPCLVWRGTTHKIEVGRPMPPFGKGTQDCWRPLPAAPGEGE